MLKYSEFCELTSNKQTTSMVMVDDYNNKYDYILIFRSLPYEHFKIGGQWNLWKRVIVAFRTHEDAEVMVGAPMTRRNETLYFNVKRT